MKTSILSVGTELTQGQILNRNAPWISARLKEFGILNTLHLTVPDDYHQMLRGLTYCAENVDFVFVTGGLGPTSDDFTRDVVAKWLDRKLIWHEESWQHIHHRLSSRGLVAKEIQKQQAFFPEGAQILVNQQGTANGFYLQASRPQGDLHLYVLPGPPREVESIWNDHIVARLQKLCQGLDAFIVRSWDTLGLGESDIAERVEKVLQNCPLEKGYRVHWPYVEFKLTYLRSQATLADPWVNAVTQALQSVTVTRDETDLTSLLTAKLMNYPRIVITDTASGSFLWSRLQQSLKPLVAEHRLDFLSQSTQCSPEALALSLQSSTEKPELMIAAIDLKGQRKESQLAPPSLLRRDKERVQAYYAEMAMLSWLQMLKAMKS